MLYDFDRKLGLDVFSKHLWDVTPWYLRIIGRPKLRMWSHEKQRWNYTDKLEPVGSIDRSPATCWRNERR